MTDRPTAEQPRLLKRPSGAMLVALLSLFISLGGTAIAAHHYLISSTKQISPKVLKALRGETGAKGAAGAAGSPGAPGKDGANLTAETVLPSGQSESGAFAAGGGWETGGENEKKEKVFGYIGTGITYTQPLAKAISDKNIIDVTTGTTLHCPGVGKADPGYLCLYDGTNQDVDEGYGYSDSGKFSVPSPGVELYWEVKEVGEPYVGGEWTVTAP